MARQKTKAQRPMIAGGQSARVVEGRNKSYDDPGLKKFLFSKTGLIIKLVS